MTTPLPPQDPREPDEALPGEAELAALYRQLPQNEPGPALDAAVLRAAAQALETDGAQPAVPVERRKASREPGDWVHPKPAAVTPAAPAGSARKLRPRWLVGLSSAAALVLAVGLAWRMHESPQTESAPVASGSVAPAQAEAATAATNAPMPPAPLPAPPKQPPPRIIAAAPPAPMAAKSRQVVADKQAAPVSRDEQQLAGAAPRARADVTGQASNEAATNAAKPAVAEAAASAPSMQATMVAAPAPVAAAADTATNAGDMPAQELDKIRQLFAQGHDDEAQQRLAAFRHAHPRWELPPELQAKLRKP
jgi:resuscitation-promoting factor RpfA